VTAGALAEIDLALDQYGRVEIFKKHRASIEAAASDKFDKNRLEDETYGGMHGLCESGVIIGVDGHLAFGQSIITAAGLDFLEDDGGLSAILGVVTVKLHADTIRDLIDAKIETSSLPAEEKSKLRKALAGLSEAGLREVITGLVKIGLNHLPDAAHWLHSLGLP
jgi:hypothetical protein